MHLAPPATLALLLAGCPAPDGETGPPIQVDTAEDPGLVVLAWPARAMNPMDPSYATASLRPPGVTLRAQVLERGLLPTLVDHDGYLVSYQPVDPAQVTGATDFWEHALALLGEQAPASGVGLAGLAIEGTFQFSRGLYEAQGIPVVPAEGLGEACFPLFELQVIGEGGFSRAQGLVVAPSSSDLGCRLCHGDQWQGDVLAKHDERHESTLSGEASVRCGECHAQPELGWAGDSEAAALATAMHGAHSSRMEQLQGSPEPACLACHPGPDTPFYRGNHTERDTGCEDCHGSMEALASPERVPWQDLPRCDDCHQTPGIEYQQPGVSFGESVGHGGLRCPVCHHAPHALYRSELEADNAQNLELQGYAGVVSTCRVCHEPNPGGLFPHVVDP
jgi:hypothetical protein